VRRHFSVACLLLAWLCANGAVWNVVQVVGWTKMLRDNSRVMTLAQALEVTFDGSTACKFCHLAEQGQDASRDAQPSTAPDASADKILLIAECVPAPVLFAPGNSWPGATDASGRLRTEAVPVPPPRV